MMKQNKLLGTSTDSSWLRENNYEKDKNSDIDFYIKYKTFLLLISFILLF